MMHNAFAVLGFFCCNCCVITLETENLPGNRLFFPDNRLFFPRLALVVLGAVDLSAARQR